MRPQPVAGEGSPYGRDAARVHARPLTAHPLARGAREIIGLGIGRSEAETFWIDFPRSLKPRGLDGVMLAISDAHTGPKGVISRVFEATWRRCRVHWIRDALAHLSKGQHMGVAAAIGQAFDEPDREHAGEPGGTSPSRSERAGPSSPI